MTLLVVQVLGIGLQIFITLLFMDYLLEVESKKQTFLLKLLCIMVNIVIFSLGGEEIWYYAIGSIFEVLSLGAYGLILSKSHVWKILSIISLTNILNIIFTLLSGGIFLILFTVQSNSINISLIRVFVYICRSLLFYVIYRYDQKKHISKVIMQIKPQAILVISGIVVLAMRQILNFEIQSTYIIISIIATVVGFLWVVDSYRIEEKQIKLLEENKRLAAEIHKSREVFPALKNTLEKIKEGSQLKELNTIVDSVHQLCAEQMIEHEKEANMYRSYPKTDISVLDEQIQRYGNYAANSNINFEVYINVPVKKAIGKNNISQLDFVRLIGDLVTNAFHAMERKEMQGGNILLIIGVTDGYFQIEIADDGVPFPMKILNQFGVRGITDGGTGNGIADILTIAKQSGATLELEEHVAGYYTKEIRVIWNDRNDIFLISERGSNVSVESRIKVK